MTDELVSKSQMKRIAIQKGDALPPRRICEHGSQEVKCLICENAALEDEIERLTLDWAREQGERTTAENERDRALLEIERLRAEVAALRTDMHDELLAEQAKRLQAESALAALRKRVEEAPVYCVPSTKPSSPSGWAKVIRSVKHLNSLRGKRVALVVLGEG
jgi:hypothetical protein